MSDMVQVDVQRESPPATPAPQEGEQEKLYAGKFKTVEDMEASYKELESKLGSPSPASAADDGTPNQAPPETPEGDEPPVQIERQTPPQSPIDFASYNETFQKEGKLTEEQLTHLESQGFSREIVDVYLRGLKAGVDDVQATAYEAAGGSDQYAALAQWAGVNLSDEDLEAYNTAVNSGSLGQIKLAVAGLRSRYQEAMGTESNLQGGNGQVSGGDAYTSMKQLQADQQDPRYRTDPAFRKAVEDKLRRSPNL